jgi:hypothetical protein
MAHLPGCGFLAARALGLVILIVRAGLQMGNITISDEGEGCIGKLARAPDARVGSQNFRRKSSLFLHLMAFGYVGNVDFASVAGDFLAARCLGGATEEAGAISLAAPGQSNQRQPFIRQLRAKSLQGSGRENRLISNPSREGDELHLLSDEFLRHPDPLEREPDLFVPVHALETRNSKAGSMT